MQPTAALIVFGGTLGAVMLQFPLTTVVAAFRSLGICLPPREARGAADSRAGGICQQGAPQGVVSLDADLQAIQDPFLKQTLMLAVDGTEPVELRKIMHVTLESPTEEQERLPAVFESAGDFRRPSAFWALCSA